jgi:hypothetical protein
MVSLVRITNRYQGGQQKAIVVRDACPQCESQQFKKNGHIHNGQQNHRCKDCGRQFVLQAEYRVIDEGQRSLVEPLLLEKISLHGICRAIGVSIRWLMDFMVASFAAGPEHLHVQLPSRPGKGILRRLEAEVDELCSFVEKKAKWRITSERSGISSVITTSRETKHYFYNTTSQWGSSPSSIILHSQLYLPE